MTKDNQTSSLASKWIFNFLIKPVRFLKNDILVHSGFFNKIPLTGWLIINRNLFFTLLKAGKK